MMEGSMTHDIERHVTVDHDWEIRSDLLPMSLEELDVLPQSNMSIGRTMGQRNFTSPEPELLGDFRLGPGQVQGDILLGSTTDHLVDGLFSDLAEKIPDGEIDDRDGGEGETCGVSA